MSPGPTDVDADNTVPVCSMSVNCSSVRTYIPVIRIRTHGDASALLLEQNACALFRIVVRTRAVVKSVTVMCRGVFTDQR